MSRLLQVFNQYRTFGGEEAIVLELSRIFREGHDLRDHFFKSSDWTGSNAPSKAEQAWRSLYNPASFATLRAIHRDFRPDFWIFHNMLPVGSPSAYRAARECGAPLIQYLHNYRPFSISGSFWIGSDLAAPTLQPRQYVEAINGAWNNSVAQGLVMATAMKLLVASGWLSAVKVWVGVSPAICDHLREVGIPKKRMVAIPPPWAFDPQKKAGKADDYFLFLGRLIPEKGILLLLEAWLRISLQLGAAGPRLVVCGAGPLEAEVKAAVRENPLVEYRGLVQGPEKDALLAACRAIIVPSLWWDPNPTVLGEAFNFGKPAIAARIGGLAYRIQENVTGLLYEPRDIGHLIRHVLTLRENSTLQNSLGEAARQWLFEQSDRAAWRTQFFHAVNHVISTTES